jgi:CRP/FNR family cyclic AMP-dependent transcriptional regulator
MKSIELVGYLAAAITVATFWMRTMIPLRVAGIGSNLAWITYGLLAGVYPALILHLLVLPLNAVRLRQMIELVRKVRAASAGDPEMNWLKPFMAARHARAGEVLFRKGDTADHLLFTVSGRFRLRESGIELGAGHLVGELALLAPDQRRTQTLECLEDGRLLTIPYVELKQLFVQNPAFGFYFLRLTTERLFQNLARAEAEVERLKAAR